MGAPYFDAIAEKRDGWIKKNAYYYKFIQNLVEFYVPKSASVLEVGCGTGNLIGKLKNKKRVGIDFSKEMVRRARKGTKGVKFVLADVGKEMANGRYDWILAVNLVGYLNDIYKVFENLKKDCIEETRLLVVFHNHLWEPVLKLGERLGLRSPQPEENWLGTDDLKNLFEVLGYEVIRTDYRMLIPFEIPLLSSLVNNFVASLPVIKHLSLIQAMVLRARPETKRDYSVSIIVPARNEEGNISKLIKSIPRFGKWQELVMIEGHSKDKTWEAIRNVQYSKRFRIRAFKQKGEGKADAVRLGFEKASGEVLMILDADLTVDPRDLIKFYEAISRRGGEFINGSRLVYPVEKEAMRFLNKVGNKFFSILFSFFLGQSFKDTLCGTKVLFYKDWKRIESLTKRWKTPDPFGDFDLIFGAAKLSLKIVEIPVRYKERTYGRSNISRFINGWQLLKTSWVAFKRFVFV